MNDSAAIRPFRIAVPEDELADLRRRLAATRWPEPETVDDWSQGVPLAYAQELARYWADDYDWRAREAALNRFPQFLTEIDGLDIHFIHRPAAEPGALPLLITHGWPGSVAEFRHGAAAMPYDEPDPTEEGRWPILSPMAGGQRMPSMSSARRCPATVSPESRRPPAGGWSASQLPGTR